MELNGKIALVTGAAQGIGKAFVDHLLQHNVKVMISDMNQMIGEATKKEMALKYGEDSVKFVSCDVTNDAQFEDAFKTTKETFGKLDILINNAGIFLEADPGWKKTIAINFISAVKGTYLGMKYMGKDQGNNGGTIVNIGSVAGLGPRECTPVYAGTKSAVNQFSRSIGTKLHFNRTGVRIMTINPGATETPLLHRSAEGVLPETKEVFEAILPKIKIQCVENMGKGLIQLLKTAQPGSVWVIEDDFPPKRVEIHVEKYDN